MDERYVELESKIAFLERTVETLNEVLIERGEQLDELERQVARQGAQLAALKQRAAEGP